MDRLQGDVSRNHTEVMDILKALTDTVANLTDSVANLTEMTVRQTVGHPVPPEYRRVLINALSSLLRYLQYLESRSCAITAFSWPLTSSQVEDRVLRGLTNPVS